MQTVSTGLLITRCYTWRERVVTRQKLHDSVRTVLMKTHLVDSHQPASRSWKSRSWTAISCDLRKRIFVVNQKSWGNRSRLPSSLCNKSRFVRFRLVCSSMPVVGSWLWSSGKTSLWSMTISTLQLSVRALTLERRFLPYKVKPG